MLEATNEPAAATPSTEKVKRRGGKKIGWCGYASILRSIQQQASTAQQLAEKFDVQLTTMRRILARMHDLRVVHVQAWQQSRKRGASLPVWAHGAGTDAQRPAGQIDRRWKTLLRSTALPELVQTMHMLQVMASEPVSKVELADRVGSQHCNVTRFVNHCHRIGLVHVADWSVRLHGGRRAALYGIGPGPDVRHPRRISRSEIASRSKQGRAQRQQHLQLIHATAAPVVALPYSLAEAA